MRAATADRPREATSAGSEFVAAVVCDAPTIAMRAGAISPFSVICAKIARMMTTTSERRLPRPSSTSAREPQPFDITMP
jgi:hypothetical protein